MHVRTKKVEETASVHVLGLRLIELRIEQAYPYYSILPYVCKLKGRRHSAAQEQTFEPARRGGVIDRIDATLGQAHIFNPAPL